MSLLSQQSTRRSRPPPLILTTSPPLALQQTPQSPPSSSDNNTLRAPHSSTSLRIQQQQHTPLSACSSSRYSILSVSSSSPCCSPLSLDIPCFPFPPPSKCHSRSTVQEDDDIRSSCDRATTSAEADKAKHATTTRKQIDGYTACLPTNRCMVAKDLTQSGDMQSHLEHGTLKRKPSARTLSRNDVDATTQSPARSGLQAPYSSPIFASTTRNHAQQSISTDSTPSRLRSSFRRVRSSSSSAAATLTSFDPATSHLQRSFSASISTWSASPQSTPPRESHSNRSSSDESIESLTSSEHSTTSTIDAHPSFVSSYRQHPISRSASTSISEVRSSETFSAPSSAAPSLSPSSSDSLASSETWSPASSFQPCGSSSFFMPPTQQAKGWYVRPLILPSRIDASNDISKRSTTPPTSPPHPPAATLDYDDFNEGWEEEIFDEPDSCAISSNDSHAHPLSLETVTEVEEEPTLAYAYANDVSYRAPSSAELENSFIDFMNSSSYILPRTLSYDMLKHVDAPPRPAMRPRGYSSPALSQMPAPERREEEHVEHFGEAISPPSSPANDPHPYVGRQSISLAAREKRHTRGPSASAALYSRQHPYSTPIVDADRNDEEEEINIISIHSSHAPDNASRSTLNVSVRSRFTTNGLKSAFEVDDTSIYNIDALATAANAENKRVKRLSKKPSLWFASLRDTMVPLKPRLPPIDTAAAAAQNHSQSQRKIISAPANARHISSGAVLRPHDTIRESPFGREAHEHVDGYLSLPYEADLFAKDMAIALIGGTTSGATTTMQDKRGSQSSGWTSHDGFASHFKQQNQNARRVLHKRSSSTFTTTLRKIPTVTCMQRRREQEGEGV